MKCSKDLIEIQETINNLKERRIEVRKQYKCFCIIYDLASPSLFMTNICVRFVNRKSMRAVNCF